MLLTLSLCCGGVVYGKSFSCLTQLRSCLVEIELTISTTTKKSLKVNVKKYILHHVNYLCWTFCWFSGFFTNIHISKGNLINVQRDLSKRFGCFFKLTNFQDLTPKFYVSLWRKYPKISIIQWHMLFFTLLFYHNQAVTIPSDAATLRPGNLHWVAGNCS